MLGEIWTNAREIKMTGISCAHYSNIKKKNWALFIENIVTYTEDKI